MTPNSHCYFDHYQALPDYEPLAIGGYLTLKKVYSFDPTPPTLEEKFHKYIIGGQANVWTEYMKTTEYVEYMLNPRLAALSEALWSPANKKNWTDFQTRLQTHFKRLEQKNIKYSKGTFKIDIKVDYDKENNVALVNLMSQQYKPEIRYTINGSEPNAKSTLYKKPFKIDTIAKIKAAIFVDGKIYRGISEKTIGIHKALGAGVELTNKFHFKYTAGGKKALVDGLTGSENFGDGYWQGYEGNNFEAILDLGEIKDISKISTNFIEAYKSWIFLPEEIIYSISSNKKDFKVIKTINCENLVNKELVSKKTFSAEFEPISTKYIKIFAKNIGTCPKGHPGEGGKAWIFIDEIIVE